jgi:periplasmic copper chaperone A
MTRRWLLALLLLLPALPAAAGEGEDDHVARKGDIRVVHAWSRATAAEDGVVFMAIESLGGGGDRLTGATSELARKVAIHGAVLEDGELTSRPLEAIGIPAGGEFVLEPGAVFLKLSGLRRPLVRGQEFEVELTFAEAGALDVHVEVEAADATQHSHAGHPH